MSPFNRRRVENYTNAFLITLGVFLFFSFWVIAGVAGYVWVFVTAFAVDQVILWIGRQTQKST